MLGNTSTPPIPSGKKRGRQCLPSPTSYLSSKPVLFILPSVRALHSSKFQLGLGTVSGKRCRKPKVNVKPTSKTASSKSNPSGFRDPSNILGGFAAGRGASRIGESV